MKHKKLEVLARDYNVSLFPLFILLQSFTGGIKPVCGRALSDLPLKFERGTVSYLCDFAEKAKLNRYFTDKVIKNPVIIFQLKKKILTSGQRLLTFCRTAYRSDLTGKSNRMLWQKYEKFCRSDYDLYNYGLPLFFLDHTDQELWSQMLHQYLEEKIRQTGARRSVAEYFMALTTPLQKSFARLEEESLWSIAVCIQSKQKISRLFQLPTAAIAARLPRMNSVICRKIHQHASKFGWIPYVYEGPAYADKDYIKIIKDILQRRVRADAFIEKEYHQTARLQRKQKQYYRELWIDRQYQKLFAVGREIAYLKPFRRAIQTHAHYYIEGLLREIAKRLQLTTGQVRFMLPDEVKCGLFRGEVQSVLYNERARLSICSIDRGKVRVLIKKQAANFLKKVVDIHTSSKEKIIHGTSAYPGKRRGVVKLIDTPDDLRKAKKGYIMVSYATNPNLMPAIRQAAAIVTDEGGLTCHAAIVAREFKIPCIIGTKIATQVLRDGNLVEVDATRGLIRKLR